MNDRRQEESADVAALEARIAELEGRLRAATSLADRLQRVVAHHSLALARARQELSRLDESFGVRAVERYRALRDEAFPAGTRRRRAFGAAVDAVKKTLRAARASRAGDPAAEYAGWISRHERPARRDASLEADVTLGFAAVLDRGGAAEVEATTGSLTAQLRPEWTLCIIPTGWADGGGLAAARQVAEKDRRVRVGEACADARAAYAAALREARGDFVAPIALGDELAPGAVAAIARALGERPDLDVVYADEDRRDPSGRRVEPRFKPDWSPDLLLSTDYVGAVAAYRRSLVEATGPASDGWDLSLRCAERTDRIGHVPAVLCHRREVPDPAPQALEAAIARRGLGASVEPGLASGAWRVRYAIRGEPLVSIVIPTRDKVDLLRRAIASIEKSTWRTLEILVVDNGSVEPQTHRFLEALAGRHRVLRWNHPFNWAAINNFAAASARGAHLLFLNNDVEVIAADWIEALLEHSQRPEVGAVGTKLLYPDGRVQHAGVVLGIGGVTGHAFRLAAADAPGHCGLASVVRNVSAVTGACMMTSRPAFDALGGFDERFRVAYNDVDYCLRLRERGLRVIYTPYALLHHHEQATRGPSHPPPDEALLKERWGDALALDPHYSPNLTHAREDYGLRR